MASVLRRLRKSADALAMAKVKTHIQGARLANRLKGAAAKYEWDDPILFAKWLHTARAEGTPLQPDLDVLLNEIEAFEGEHGSSS